MYPSTVPEYLQWKRGGGEDPTGARLAALDLADGDWLARMFALGPCACSSQCSRLIAHLPSSIRWAARKEPSLGEAFL